MIESDKTLHDGFWNGEPAKYRAVMLKVEDQTKEEIAHFKKHHPNRKQYMWFKPYVGGYMEAIEVYYKEHGQYGSLDIEKDIEPFYLANIDGTGLYKVTKGMGSPQCGHMSINGKVTSYIGSDNTTHTTKELRDSVEKEIDNWWIIEGGDDYIKHKKDMDDLTEMINKSRQGSSLEDIANNSKKPNG